MDIFSIISDIIIYRYNNLQVEKRCNKRNLKNWLLCNLDKDIVMCQSDFFSRSCRLKVEFVDIQCLRSFSAFSSWNARQDALDVATSDSSGKFSSEAFPWGMRGCVNQMRYVVPAFFFLNWGSWVNLYTASRYF